MDGLNYNPLDIEKGVVGAVLADAKLLPLVVGRLKGEHFQIRSLRMVWETLLEMHQAGEIIDLMTVIERMGQDRVHSIGGTGVLIDAFDLVVTPDNIEEYANILEDRWRGRELARLLQEAHQELKDKGFESAYGKAQSALISLSVHGEKGGFSHMSDLVSDWFTSIESLRENPELREKNYLPTGFKDYDEKHGGLPVGMTILAGRPAMGKCLGKGTKVLMYDGTLKNVEDIKVGDQLMGPDSTPRNVLSLARGKEMMYWIRQNKAIDYRVNESHILSLKASGTEGSRVHGQVVNISVRDYLKKPKKYQIKHKGYKTEIDFPEKQTAIDPYLLGLWLGDGTAKSSVIHSPDREIQDYLIENAPTWGWEASVRHPKKRCEYVRIKSAGAKPMVVLLREEGLIRNKHIPDQYLYNSKELRLKLLAGLLDTDGHLTANGTYFEIIQKSQKLARQIKYLADSLGFRTNFREKRGCIRASGFIGKYYRVGISGDLSVIPTRVKRKQAGAYRGNKDWRVTGITVEPDKVDDYYGFEIDGDRLFLLEDMTVTHNTGLGINIAVNVAKRGKSVLVFSLEMTQSQLITRMLSGMAKVDSRRLEQGKLQDVEVAPTLAAVAEASGLDIYLDESATELGQIIAQIEQWRLQHGRSPDLVVIDYLGLVKVQGLHGDNAEYRSAGRVADELATYFTKKLRSQLLMLCQLNRGVEGRTDKRPLMSDIRDSGKIEQAAARIDFVYRDAYYNHDTPETNTTELITAKNRFGEVGTTKLYFESETTTFRDMPPQQSWGQSVENSLS